MKKKIIVISGSMRAGSFNTSIARALPALAPESLDVELVSIDTIPLFNQDLEAAFPAPAQALKNAVEAADGVIFVTPEYNRSIPGVLKNAIDWASRPWGQNSFAGKSALVMGATLAPTGTAIAQSHLKQVLSYLDMKIVGQPETYISSAHEKIDAEGNITDQSLKDHLAKALETYASRI